MDTPRFPPSGQRGGHGGAPRPRTLDEVRLALSTLPLYAVALASTDAPDLATVSALLLPLAGRDRVARILDALRREGIGVVATCPREIAELYACVLRRAGLPCSIFPA